MLDVFFAHLKKTVLSSGSATILERSKYFRAGRTWKRAVFTLWHPERSRKVTG
jgi:hypothetical protein